MLRISSAQVTHLTESRADSFHMRLTQRAIDDHPERAPEKIKAAMLRIRQQAEAHGMTSETDHVRYAYLMLAMESDEVPQTQSGWIMQILEGTRTGTEKLDLIEAALAMDAEDAPL